MQKNRPVAPITTQRIAVVFVRPFDPLGEQDPLGLRDRVAHVGAVQGDPQHAVVDREQDLASVRSAGVRIAR